MHKSKDKKKYQKRKLTNNKINHNKTQMFINKL